MKLSVICPALLCRDGMSPILHDIARQAEGKPVELLILADNGAMTIGEKMNHLYRTARGEWTATVADDDVVKVDYVDSILAALETNPDVVTFDVDWQSGEKFMDWKPSTCGLRPLAAVRTSIAREFVAPAWNQSEDRAFWNWLKPHVKTTEHIPRTLYGYRFRRAKAEYAGRMYRGNNQELTVGASPAPAQ